MHGQRARAFVQARAVAVRARFLFDERLDALKALRVFRFVERIEHGARGAEIREVHLARAVLLLQVVHDVPFFRGPMQHNLFFVGGEVFVRHVGAHAHLAAHVHHDRPHERAPRCDRTLLDRQVRVGDQRGIIHRAHNAGA